MMNRKLSRALPAIAAAILFAARIACAQAAPAPSAAADLWTRADLLTKAKELAVKAKDHDGAASIKLSEYPDHFTMLAYHSSNGGAEIHPHFADFFVVEKGRATLLTGGTVVDPKTAANGEVKGDSINGAKSQELRVGDAVHIPAGTPHQLLIPKGVEFVYFVIKVKQP